MLTENKNFLKSTAFQLKIDSTKYPNLEYFCTAVTMPGVSIPAASLNYKNFQGNMTGEKVTYDELAIVCNLTEDMENYKEVFNWILNMTEAEKEDYSDAILMPLNSHNNVAASIKFFDIYPTSISPIDFDSQNESTDNVPITITFDYTRFEFI